MIVRRQAAALVASLGCIVVVACSSTSTTGGINCASQSPCRADAPTTQADIDSCNKARTDATCGAKFVDYASCILQNTKCGADNKADIPASGAAAKANCANQISAYQACQAGGSGDGGASSSSGASGGTSSGGTSSGGTSSGSTSSGGTSSSGGTGCGSITWKTQACSTCMTTNCCSQQQACSADAGCTALLQCLLPCTDAACQNDCATKNPGGVSLYNALGTCFTNSCSTPCQ